jgi:hypothetical protein
MGFGQIEVCDMEGFMDDRIHPRLLGSVFRVNANGVAVALLDGFPKQLLPHFYFTDFDFLLYWHRG